MTPEEWRELIRLQEKIWPQLEQIKAQLRQQYEPEIETSLHNIGSEWSRLDNSKQLQEPKQIRNRYLVFNHHGFWQLHLWYGLATATSYLPEEENQFKVEDVFGFYYIVHVNISTWNDQGDFNLIIRNNSKFVTGAFIKQQHHSKCQLLLQNLEIYRDTLLNL